MGQTLRPEMVLERRPEEGCVLLYHRPDGNGRGRTAPVFRLHPMFGLTLALLDGRRDAKEVTRLIASATGSPPDKVRGLVDAVMRRFRQLLVFSDAEEPVRPDVDPRGFDFEASVDPRDRREAAPRSIQWVVTRGCNRRCRYCFRGSGSVRLRPGEEAGMTAGRFDEIAAEAAQIGVTNLILTGGEPMLRSDIVDIISMFASRNIEVLLTTKSLIDEPAMRRLAATSWTRVHLSLDCAEPEVVDYLTQVPGAFAQMVQTLELAQAHGVKVVLRPLMTSLTAKGFPRLIDMASRYGVEEVLVDHVGAGCEGRETGLELTAEQVEQVGQAVEEARQRHPGIQIGYRSQTFSATDRAARGCVEGLRGLTILPDGAVTKCEHWLGPELHYGDLRRQSIMEAWTSPELARLNQAPVEAFEGTACLGCAELEHCRDRRGRCSVSSLRAYGRVHAPDSYCPIGAFKEVAGQ